MSESPGQSLPCVVFDCNIYLQAAASPDGPAFACMEMAERSRFILVISDDILVEVRSILTHQAVQKKFTGLNDNVAKKFLMRVSEIAQYVSPIPAVITFSRDPKDEPYLNLALASGASYLVTRDRDILNIAEDQAEGGLQLRQTLRGIRMLDPASFLREMRSGV